MNMLKIDNLHVRVAGKEILKGLSPEVNAGEVHRTMGPDGRGKTELPTLKIAGLEPIPSASANSAMAVNPRFV